MKAKTYLGLYKKMDLSHYALCISTLSVVELESHRKYSTPSYIKNQDFHVVLKEWGYTYKSYSSNKELEW
jgi:hypothetical protein